MKFNKSKRYTGAMIAVVLMGVFALSACSEPSESTKLQQQGQQDTVDAFKKQSAAVPYPKDELSNSLERKNLSERLIRTNKADALGYVYLMSFGKVIGYYAVKGKVSSTQSQMTTDQLVIKSCDNGCAFNTVNAPGDDGSYGANEEGIFFFTTSGQMVTTNLDYIWSDNPLPIEVPLLEK